MSHAEMETFVSEVIGVLREESSALVTVGGAAMKWAHAWWKVDIDSYQFHIYDWVNMYWQYSNLPAMYGVDDKPVVMGEFPLGGLSGVPYSDLLKGFYENGYAGAMGWQYDEATAGQLADVKGFADLHSCETHY